MERPLILISNDDGVYTKGLHHLVDCVKEMGDVIVVAPDAPRSGQSSAITVGAPLRVTRHPDYEGAQIYSVNGTPVDCVKLAMHAIVPRRPDIVLSGINHGSNSGNSIIYSGTMGAVLEASMLDIPSIGYSLLHHSLKADFSETTPFIKLITAKVLAEGLPKEVCLNVNFPAMVKIKGLKVVEAARGHWTEEYKDYIDPSGHPFYMLTGKYQPDNPDDSNTDVFWLDREYATVVPARADQTAADAIGAVSQIIGV